jgi:pimeloyl-ACP methyl ester carboxylesterase
MRVALMVTVLLLLLVVSLLLWSVHGGKPMLFPAPMHQFCQGRIIPLRPLVPCALVDVGRPTDNFNGFVAILVQGACSPLPSEVNECARKWHQRSQFLKTRCGFHPLVLQHESWPLSTFDRRVRDLRAAIEYTYTVWRDARILVIGHSFGAVVGAATVADPGTARMTAGLVCLNPPISCQDTITRMSGGYSVLGYVVDPEDRAKMFPNLDTVAQLGVPVVVTFCQGREHWRSAPGSGDEGLTDNLWWSTNATTLLLKRGIKCVELGLPVHLDHAVAHTDGPFLDHSTWVAEAIQRASQKPQEPQDEQTQ